jgi:ribose-phosphate pyrophosphokinase
MTNINLITGGNVSFTLYPDNQPHVQVQAKPGEQARVVVRLASSLDLVHLMMVANALDHLFVDKTELVIPYLMGARFDRIMQPGDSLDLEVVADCINRCGFKRVQLFDVHSDVATALIKNSKSHDNSRLVKAYVREKAVLICPDSGAAKKISKYLEWNPYIDQVVYCIKERDVTNGRLNLKVLAPEACDGRNCVIIDDLCDGGATFIAIAQQIGAAHLTLIVSHGIFSKGFSLLEKYFDEIITTNSYRSQGDGKIVRCIDLGL